MKKYPEYKQLDLSSINKEVLAEWRSNSIFEKSLSTREGKPSYTFYEGPPSANGMRVFITLWDERLKMFSVVLKPYKDIKSIVKQVGILTVFAGRTWR